MKKRTILTLMGFILMGCAVQKELVATGGSKADGIIELSYTHGPLDVPKVNEEQGLITAKKRCAAWGYKNAEKFGGQKRSCSIPGGFSDCAEFMVTVQYQCMD